MSASPDPCIANALLIIRAILAGVFVGLLSFLKGLTKKEDGKFVQFLRKMKVI